MLGDILDHREGRLEEAFFTEAQHARSAKGTPQGGQFISTGSSGAGVSTVQQKVGAARDGQFGGQTKQAVMAFQRQHGLTVDGVVGHQTAAALLGQKNASKVKIGALTAADRKALGPHSGGTHKASKGARTKTVKAATKSKTPAPPKPYTTARGRASYFSKRSGGIVA